MEPIEWIYLIVMLIVLAAAIAMMPRPKSQPPPSLSDLNVPTAEDGREVVDCMGTCWIADPNVTYYGNLRTIPIYASGGK